MGTSAITLHHPQFAADAVAIGNISNANSSHRASNLGGDFEVVVIRRPVLLTIDYVPLILSPL